MIITFQTKKLILLLLNKVKNYFSPLTDKTGIALLQALIAGGVLASLTITLVKISNIMSTSNRKYYQNFEQLSKMNEIDRALIDRNSCMFTLTSTPIVLPVATASVPVNYISTIMAGTPSTIAKIGDTFTYQQNNTSGQLTLSKMTIQRQNTSPFTSITVAGTPGYSGSALMRFYFTRPGGGIGNLGGSVTKVDRVVQVMTDNNATSGTIKDCYSNIQDAYYSSACQSLGGTFDGNGPKCKSLLVQANGSNPAIMAIGNVNVTGFLKTSGNLVVGPSTFYSTPNPNLINAQGNITLSSGNIITNSGNITASGYISNNGDIISLGNGNIYTSSGSIWATPTGNIYTNGGDIYTGGSGYITTGGGNIYTTGSGDIYTSGGNIYTQSGDITSANNITAKSVIINNGGTNSTPASITSDGSGYLYLNPNTGTSGGANGYTVGRIATENWVYNSLSGANGNLFPDSSKQAIINTLMVQYGGTPSNGLDNIKRAVGTDIKNANYLNGASNPSCNGFMTGISYNSSTQKYNITCNALSYTSVYCKAGEFIKSIDSSGVATCTSLIKQQRYYFGGAFDKRLYTNPMTGSMSCPNYYKEVMVLNASGIDWPLYMCFFDSWQGTYAPNYYKFGGIYGDPSWANPITGASSCPSGFTRYKVFDNPGRDFPFYICWDGVKTYTSPPDNPYEFGGIWSPYVENGNNYNYFTNYQTCPGGFNMSTVYGYNGVDYALNLCWRVIP